MTYCLGWSYKIYIVGLRILLWGVVGRGGNGWDGGYVTWRACDGC